MVLSDVSSCGERDRTSYAYDTASQERDGEYDIRGDNTFRFERGIKDTEIIGVVDAFTHNGKTVRTDDRWYKAYVRTHCLIYPVRWALFMGRRAAGKCVRGVAGAVRKIKI